MSVEVSTTETSSTKANIVSRKHFPVVSQSTVGVWEHSWTLYTITIILRNFAYPLIVVKASKRKVSSGLSSKVNAESSKVVIVTLPQALMYVSYVVVIIFLRKHRILWTLWRQLLMIILMMVEYKEDLWEVSRGHSWSES